MHENTQNLFQNFDTSIDLNKERQEMENTEVPVRKQRRSNTYTKLNENKSMDSAQLQQLNTSLFTSFHMFKKSVSTEQIFYGKTSQQQLYQMLFDYLKEIIEQPQKLNKQIKNLNFQNVSGRENNQQMSPLKLSHKKSSKLDRIFTQCNLTKSVSLQFDRSNLSNVQKNNSGLSVRSGQKTQNEEEVICSQFASIQEVQSQRMQDSMRLIHIEDSTEPDQMAEQSQQPQPKRNANVSIRMMLQNDVSDHKMKDFDMSQDKVKDSDSSEYKIKGNQSIQKMIDNNLSSAKIQKSTTSFGFDFDKRMGGNILQQVSIMFLNNHSIKDNQSQVSLSLKGSFQGAESSFFSQTSSENVSLKDISERVDIPLTKQFLTTLYYEPEPFLVTISLVYLLKYLYHSAHMLTNQSVSILLATSLLVSYKIYEDQPISGLVEYLVDDALNKKMTKQEMIKFERHFLQTISYEVVIGNQQFYRMLAMIKDINIVG